MGKKPSLAKNTSKPSSQKRAPSEASLPSATTTSQALGSAKVQQRLLNIFNDAFNDLLQSDTFPALLQEVKQALFEREFAKAFGREDYLEAYAARWSPTRALCYLAVFSSTKSHLDGLKDDYDAQSSVQPLTEGSEAEGLAESFAHPSLGDSRAIEMLCIGGCAAEQVAFAAYLSNTQSRGTLTLLDSGPWTHVVSTLQTQITSPPGLSKYASEAAKAASKALLEPSQLSLKFKQDDILALDPAKLRDLVGSRPLAVTLLFTLNELYTSAGIGKTTKFLRALSDALPSGSFLLVVDSPGSYSEAAVGKKKKRYPMQWLLDHTLMETESDVWTWERVESQDSVWFRLPEGLSYPIQLENMRYQIHLYRIQKT